MLECHIPVIQYLLRFNIQVDMEIQLEEKEKVSNTLSKFSNIRSVNSRMTDYKIISTVFQITIKEMDKLEALIQMV